MSRKGHHPVPDSSDIAAALVRLSFLVQGHYARICGRHDLSPAQAELMCVIKDQARGMTELTRMLGVERPGLTGLVDRIERRGLARRDTNPHDRRAVTVALTPQGKRITDSFYAEVSDALRQVVAHLPAADQQRFADTAFDILLAERVPAIFGDSAGRVSAPE
ncbi:MarR family winged helix-turn-helix transcriptional regulator [Actinoplanes sp. NPDC049265]|uniref:MarR family winged helix-turn-helix transcriptional regulator n=1 Tax=Actinoplanes sp. NPDC049265 TaxID=3363902 RepID=UPI0037249F8E